jgi:hypothetical protein
MADRKKLSDILLNGERERLEKLWANTKPATDLNPIPPGKYRCRIADGSPFEAKTGTKGYRIDFVVLDGEHAGRRLFHSVYFTEGGARYALLDLSKIGVVRLEQLDSPLPEGIIVEANVVLRRGDDGSEYNELRRTCPFVVVAFEPPAPEPFAPAESNSEGADDDFTDKDGFNWRTGKQEGGDTP